MVRWSRSQLIRARVAPARTPVINARVIRVRRGSGLVGGCRDRVIGCSLGLGYEKDVGYASQGQALSEGLFLIPMSADEWAGRGVVRHPGWR